MAEAAAFGAPPAPARHALLRVRPQGYARALDRLGERPEPIVAEWARQGRPLIARRRGPCDVAPLIAAGLPLPPQFGKRRIALSLEAGALEATLPPPLLLACAPVAPQDWRATIGAIDDLAARAGVEARCFGSLAWAALTGLAYLGRGSDLDLLVLIDARSDAALLLVGLKEIAGAAPIRLDGEIIRPDGRAAHWRELCSDAAEILVKSQEGAALMSREAFLEPFATGRLYSAGEKTLESQEREHVLVDRIKPIRPEYALTPAGGLAPAGRAS